MSGNGLKAKSRQLVLIVIMMAVAFLAILIVIASLYAATIEQEKRELFTLVQSQVALIESVVEFDSKYSIDDHPGGSREATISQLINAYDKANVFGKTGEFVLASLVNGEARFLFKSHAKYSDRLQKAMDSHSTEESRHTAVQDQLVVMTHALNGETGVGFTKDYGLVDVLAAYTWIDTLKIGLVAKIDVAEIQEPFIKAALMAVVFCVPAVLLGYFLFMKFSNKFVSDLEEQRESLSSVNEINKNIFMLSPVGMALYDKNGDCIEANDVIVQIVGATREKVLEQNYNKIESWKNSGLLEMAKKTVAENRPQYQEFTLTTTFGQSLTIDAHMVTFGSGSGKHYLLLLVEDISERVEAVSALARSEETFSKAQEIAHIGSWDWNIVTNELKWSDEIYRIFGLEAQQFSATYDAFLEYIHPDDKQAVIEAVNTCVGDRDVKYKIEHRIIRSSGEERIVMEQGKVYWSEDNNQPVRMIGTVHDITERKRTEAALIYEEGRLRATFDQAAVGIAHVELDGTLKKVNQEFADITGYSIFELEKLTFQDITHADDLEADMDNVKRLLDGEINTYSMEKRYISKDKKHIWVELTVSLVRKQDGTPLHFISIVNDIMQRKKIEVELTKHHNHLEELVKDRTHELEVAQYELVRKERLATLGQLTATVSHELRNPLAAMRLSLYFIQKNTGVENEKLRQAVERLDRNVTRCDHIIDELLDFTRVTDMELKTVVFDDWLESMLAEHPVPEEIQFRRELSLGDLEVDIDPNRLRRAVVNTIENACHAMREGKDPNRVIENARLTVTTETKAGRIEIGIQDTGTGIPEDAVEKIFEPLFSTKSFGVGLGMPIIEQIMEQHSGGVDIDSEVGKGTTVTLWISLA
ncbi:MAG: PAS domain S-box protein [Gammaproteobacteria bacterium]|nr:PAS domain S-box protein [Gammaproteobacteria bacterium]